jgi:hypothetical protein
LTDREWSTFRRRGDRHEIEEGIFAALATRVFVSLDKLFNGEVLLASVVEEFRLVVVTLLFYILVRHLQAPGRYGR